MQIALEADLRISAEHWSTLLYGDNQHIVDMQSILSNICESVSLPVAVKELDLLLQRNGMKSKYWPALLRVFRPREGEHPGKVRGSFTAFWIRAAGQSLGDERSPFTCLLDALVENYITYGSFRA